MITIAYTLLTSAAALVFVGYLLLLIHAAS